MIFDFLVQMRRTNVQLRNNNNNNKNDCRIFVGYLTYAEREKSRPTPPTNTFGYRSIHVDYFSM